MKCFMFSAVVLFLACVPVLGVTSHDPCDPMRLVKLLSVAETPELKLMIEYRLNASWLVESLRFINCSKRGLSKIPRSIASDVQVLDLSKNVINEIKKENFQPFTSLQVLWLYSNCLGDATHVHFYCQQPGIFDDKAFSSLTNLKVLNLGGNAFKELPENLPTSLEYLDISRTGLHAIKKSNFDTLRNLIVIAARNICYYKECYSHFANDTFENLGTKMLSLSENKGVINSISRINPKVIYLDLHRIKITKLTPEYFKNFSSLRHLELHLLYPNKKLPIIIKNHTFDQLVQLAYLDLSCNMITHIPKDMFRYNQYLSYLDLSGNCLLASVLDPDFVPPFHIKYLYLGFTNCRPPGKVNDPIKPLIMGPSFSKMKKLKFLSFGKPRQMNEATLYAAPLTFHQLNNATISVLKDLEHLENVIIEDSFIRNLDMYAILQMKSLRSIQLPGNKIANITFSGSSFPVPVKLHWKTENTSDVCAQEFSLILSDNMIDRLRNSWLRSPNVTHLDLSFNVLTTIQDNSFKNLPCLTHLDIQNNPFVFIHTKAFNHVNRLTSLRLSSTKIIHSRTSLHFLKDFQAPIYLQLKLGNLFNLLGFTLHHQQAPNVTEVDLSNNAIPSPRLLELGIHTFSNVKKLILKNCKIISSQFVLPAVNITYLDLSDNELKVISTDMLKGLNLLEVLLMSGNKITHFSNSIFNENPNLRHLDLSQNLIAKISSDSDKKFLENLKVLQLQNNYIYQLSSNALPLSFLSHLDYLDLRWNSIECSCDITKNFGSWLSKQPYALSDRPGLMPHCSASLNGFGGCVTCVTSSKDNTLEQSLLQYSTKNTCSSFFNITLCLAFTTSVVFFLLVGCIFTSSIFIVWIVKLATRSIRHSNDDQTLNPSFFAFHGFVLFDTNNPTVCDWVEDFLLPELNEVSPSLSITVAGKDDQCGFPQAQQLVFKIEASRRVILILSGNYWKSHEGRYVLSILETLKYQTGIDRALIVTFESDRQVGGLLRRREKESDWLVMKVPEDQRDWPIFWETLRNVLQ